MHYYSHNIGDYRRDTLHLTMLEHGAYRTLLDSYYLSEEPLHNDEAQLMRKCGARTEEEKNAVRNVLADFFTLTADGYVQKRCDEVVAEYQSNNEKQVAAGKASAAARAAKKANESTQSNNERSTDVQQTFNDRSTTVQPTNNHKPITINHKPKTNQDTTVDEKEEDALDEMPDVCRSLRGLGVSIADQRQKLPEITALVNQGATLEHFTAGLYVANDAGKGFGYALGVVKGKLTDAAKPQQARASPNQSRMENLSQVKDNSLAERVAAKLAEQKNEPKTIEAQ